MKYSQYIMMSPWDRAESFFWEIPTVYDKDGKVLKTKKIPAFIAKYRTDDSSKARGQIVCVRNMTMTIAPPQLPQ